MKRYIQEEEMKATTLKGYVQAAIQMYHHRRRRHRRNKSEVAIMVIIFILFYFTYVLCVHVCMYYTQVTMRMTKTLKSTTLGKKL